MPFPAQAFQCTAFFQDNQNSVGWTETYYRDSANIAAAETAFATLMLKRADILCDTYGIIYRRVSDTSIHGDSLVINTFIPGTVNSLIHIPCEPWTALMTRLEAGSTKRGRKFFHGVPRDMFFGSRNYDPGNPTDGAVIILDAALVNVAWGIRINTVPGPTVVYGYSSITAAGPQRQVEHKVGRPFGLLHGRR